jgi:hypothetical protein
MHASLLPPCPNPSPTPSRLQVLKAIEKLKKTKGQATQGRLESFFGPSTMTKRKVFVAALPWASVRCTTRVRRLLARDRLAQCCTRRFTPVLAAGHARACTQNLETGRGTAVQGRKEGQAGDGKRQGGWRETEEVATLSNTT